MVGEGTLSVMVWDIFHSRLYSADGIYVFGKRPLRLEIEYLRAFKRDSLVSQIRKEWVKMGLRGHRQNHWLSSLQKIWPDVKRDDIMTLEVDERNQSHFLLNGESLGNIDSAEFTQSFLKIWLSPEGSYSRLRSRLTATRSASS